MQLKKRVKGYNWYCLSLVYEVVPEDSYSEIISEVKSIFGTSCAFFLPGDIMCGGSFDTYCEGYVFVYCDDVENYEGRIRKSGVFYGCRDELGNVMIVSDDEIIRMQLHFEANYRKRFDAGELVRVKKGLFSSLMGVVTTVYDDHRYEVFFKLFYMEMQGMFGSQNLDFVRSAYIRSKVERIPLTRIPLVRIPLVRLPLLEQDAL